MIVGIGIDVVRIERVEPNLAKRILTDAEMEEFSRRRESLEYLAGRFALKEAFFKALGTGLRGYSFKDVEFTTGELGEPVLRVMRDFRPVFKFAHVSLSHDFLAVAVVVLEWRKGGIILEGRPSNLEILKDLGEGLYEVEVDVGPYELIRILEGTGGRWKRYWNIWRG